MSKSMPIIIKYRSNDFVFEVCYGEIPDIYMLLWFEYITEFELPDTKESNEVFQDWICRYRKASDWVSNHMLRMSQCN